MQSFATAREVFDAHPALRELVAAKATEAPPAVFLGQLLASRTPEDAVAFCAYALPAREAVWWASYCVTALQADRIAHGDDRLRAAQDWMRSPGDRERRAALATGLNADRRNPATWVALAAGWSGEPDAGGTGSTARAVATAILDALARVGARDRAERLNACVRIGVQLVQQGGR